MATPKAFVTEIVVSKACVCSTPPSTASLVACTTCAVNAAPILPIAAASAAIFIVSSTATPYLVYSFARCWICLTIASVSSCVVNISPYTRLNLIACSSSFINVLEAVTPSIASGTVKPTINCRPAHWVFLPKFRRFVDPCFNN